VYLIDDDAAVRRSLANQLGNYGIEAWPFAGGAEFVAMIGHLRPSCILLDMEMPHMSGLEVLAELVGHDIDWPVIALSSRGDLNVAIDAMKLGAVDFLQKPVQLDLLEAALAFAEDSLDRSLEAGLARQQAQERIARLTRREVDIGLALLRGMANKSAAHELGISVRTVEMHRAHILEKLGVKSLAEAAVLMTQAGLTFGRSEEPSYRQRFALQFCLGRKAASTPLGSLSRGTASGGAPLRTPEGGGRREREPRRLPPLSGGARMLGGSALAADRRA
jgi:two-component system response regulator FixJ